jgi:hypothetical protein
MNNKILWGLLLVAAIVLVGAYTYNKDKVKKFEENREQAITEEVQKSSITINAKHQFKDGQHLFVGLVELPNPCYKISTNVERTSTETVININYASTSEVCTEVIEEKEFRVSFAGKAEENIITKLNGEVVNLNIFEVAADKNIDDVKIFNKG